MSLQSLILDTHKPWLNTRVNSMAIDTTLTVNGQPINPNPPPSPSTAPVETSNILNLDNSTDQTLGVGNIRYYNQQTVSTSGKKIIHAFISEIPITNHAQGQSQLEFKFTNPQTLAPSSVMVQTIFVDDGNTGTMIRGLCKLGNGFFVVDLDTPFVNNVGKFHSFDISYIL